MFTFGRQQELNHALASLRKPEQAALAAAVIDAVHDLLEGKSTSAPFEAAVMHAFIDGGSGVWEKAGSWLRKTGFEFAQVNRVWTTLAAHESATVRYRVACFLDEMPAQEYAQVSAALGVDTSRKVAAMARARIEQVSSGRAAG